MGQTLGLGFAIGDKGLRIARVLYGVALIFFGASHFISIVEFNYTAGTQLAAGASILGVFLRLYLHRGGRGYSYRCICPFGSRARGAADGNFHAAGVGTHAGGRPHALHHWVELEDELVVSWTLTACGWVVADSYRGMPWLAVNKR